MSRTINGLGSMSKLSKACWSGAHCSCYSLSCGCACGHVSKVYRPSFKKKQKTSKGPRIMAGFVVTDKLVPLYRNIP